MKNIFLLRNSLIIASFFIIICAPMSGFGQSTANYNFTNVATGSLTTMTTATALLGPVATGGVLNNAASAVTTIPFTFYFMGTAYTQFSVNSNGQMSLGATAIGAAAQTVALSTALLVPLSGSNTIEAAGSASYLVTGISPNRTLTVDWSNLRIPSSATATTTNLSEMQVRIHEGSGVIEYVYGAMYNYTASTLKSVFISSSNTANTVGSLFSFTAAPAYYTVATPYTTSLVVGNIPLLNSTANGSRRIFSFATLTQPTAPTWAATPITSITGNGMTLNWNDNSTTESGYQIYRSTDNLTFTLIATLPANTTTYAATGLTDATTYYWKVVAFNEGTAPTTTSVISQVTPLASPTWAATPITLPTTSGMTLNWIDNSSNETGYQIYNSTDNTTFNLVTTTAANSTSYSATGLSTFTNYFWKIAAVSGVTTSAFSPVSSLSTLDIAPIAPTWAATPITNPTTAGMTLNWIDNSTNETGFEIYRSTDNITFTKIVTTAANATSYIASGLSISTLYYWKVDAVNSGGSSAQTTANSLSTTATSTFTSIATGNWSSGSTWSTGGVPALTDDVIISTGNTVTIDAVTNNAKSLTVNGSLIYNATTASALTINGSVTVASGGSFTSPLSGTIITHALNIGGSLAAGVGGDLLVNGVFDMNVFSTAGVVVTFFGTSSNTITGTGATINFYSIVVNKGTSNGSMLDVQSLITCADATSTLPLRLSLTSGTFKLSSSSILRPFYGTVQPTQSASKLWLSNSTAIIQGVGAGTVAGTNGTLTFMGILQIDAGTLAYGNGTSTLSCIGNFIMSGVNSTLNVYGSFYSSSGSTYTITGGNINIYPQVGINYVQSGYFTQGGLFLFTGSALNFTGGTLTFIDPTPAVTSGLYLAPYSLYINGGTNNFAGSTIRFGDGLSDLAGGNGFTIYPSNAPLGNVIVNNLPTSTSMTRNVTLLGNVSIGGNLTINGGTANNLALSTFALTLGGNLTNAGTITSNNVSTSGLTFNGAAQQIVTNTGTLLSNIPNLTINNSSLATPSVDIKAPLTVSTALNLTNGQLGSSNASILTLGNSVVSTTFTMTRNGGSLAVLPTFALSGVTYNTNYNAPAVAGITTTGFELPASTNIGTFTVNNTSGVILDKPVSCTTLALTAGILTATSTNSITVTGPLATNITGGSATSYVNGPLTRTIPNNAVAANYKFYIGKTSYRLFEFSSLTTGGTGTGTFTAEAFDAGPYTGTVGTGLSVINTDKYWTLTGALGTVTITSSNVRLTDVGLIPVNRIGQSNSTLGAFNNAGGLVTGGTTVASTSPVDFSTLAAGTFFRIGAATGFAPGTYAIGPTGAFPSVTAAVAAITGVPLTGNIIFELQSTYSSSVETYPIALTSNIVSSAIATVTFRPALGVTLPINFTAAGTVINNTGARFITFDGRIGGTGTNQYLQFTNTATTTPTVSLSGDVINNQFLYCVLKGSNTTTSSGVVAISAPVTGNNNISFSNCNFDGSSSASNCLYISGIAATATISYNNFFDYRNGGGVYLANGSTNCIIDNNNFYQTTTYNAVAGTAYGIYVNGGDNCQISNNNIGGNAPGLLGTWTISAITPVVCSFTGIYASTGTTVTSRLYNNKIQNFNWNANSGASWTGIFIAGNINTGTTSANYVGNNTTSGNILFTCYTAGSLTMRGIYSTATAGFVENNIVGSLTAAANGAVVVSSTVYGLYCTGTQTVRNNIIGSATVAQSIFASTAGGTNTMDGIYGGPIVTANTVANLYSSAAGLNRGIENATSVSNNTIFSITTTGITTGNSSAASLIGIYAATGSVVGNTIYNLVNTGAGAVSVYGILYRGSTDLPTNLVDKNMIHSISTSSNTAYQAGIYLDYGTASFRNNVIRLGIDVNGNSITSTPLIYGMFVGPMVGCCVSPANKTNILFNTVYIGGSNVVAGTVKSYALYLAYHGNYSGTGPGEDIRNNIFVNTRTNAVANPLLNYAILLPAPMAGVPFTCDYNIYKVSSTDGKLAVVNAVDALTIKALQDSYSNVTDLHSGFGDPLLANPAVALATLDLRPASVTQAEGTGIAITTITDDITGALRSTNTPTDIGAYSGNFTLTPVSQDIFAPYISYSNILNGSSTVSRLTANFATITDNVKGINVTSGTRPRLYYKLIANNNVFLGNTAGDNGWKWVEATGTTSPFNFNIDYSILNGGPVVLGSVIQYFVVGQNMATIPVVSFNPSIGAIGTSVASVTTAPTTPNSYTIVASIPSALNVGTGQTYTSLTGTLASGGLFAAINGGAINANTVVTITSDLTEPGTTSLNLVNEEGSNAGALTLTIQSDANPHVISGTAVAASAPMIPITGAVRFTIDGGASKLLTFRNTNATPASTGPVIQFSNNSQNCTVQNCFIESNSTSTSNGAITFGTGTNIVTINKNDIRDARGGTIGSPTNGIYSYLNSANTFSITNNNIYNQKNATSYGIYLYYFANGCTVTGNNFYMENGTITVGPYTGIFVQSSNNPLLVTGNYIGGSAPLCGGSVPFAFSGAAVFTGIYLYIGGAQTSTIQGNMIQNISMTNTGNTTFYGINNAAPGAVNLIGNVIGSATTANSIQIAGTGISAGINQTYGYYVFQCTLDNNTIANITLTNATGTPTFYGMKTYSNYVRKNSIYNIGTSSNIGITIYGIYNYFNNGNSFINEFSNNVISLNGGASTTPTIYGFYETSTNGTTGFYNNSINIYGTASGTTPSYAFYRSAAGTYNFNNNILVNSRTGGTGINYAIYSVPTTLFTSNYNDFYVSGTTLGHWGAAGTTYDNANIAAWKTASLQDANSISADPLFTSSTNLLPLNSSPVNGMGTPVASVTTDIIGTLRSITAPSLGAYESICVGPTIGGTIAANQTICNATIPALITSTLGASGNSGVLEYKWQSSVSPFTTWIDIASSNSATFQSVALTQTTQFKRVARSTCMTSWTGAVESNVITITVESAVAAAGSITGSLTFTPGTTAVPYSVGAIANATSYIWSYSGTGATINGTGASVTIDFAANATSGQLTVVGHNSCGNGAASNIALSSNITLNLTSVMLQSLYSSAGVMLQAWDGIGPHWPVGIADVITIELHSSATASYGTILYSTSGVQLSTTGNATVTIPGTFNGSYYITIKHRNSLETTTAAPISFVGSIINQSFGAPANVFGGNLFKSADGHYMIYGGDVNQDGVIDIRDYINVDNDAYMFASGYLITDVNGDGVIDIRDYIIIDNNNFNFISSMHP